MQRAWLWAGAGALMGGVVGASLGITLTRDDAPATVSQLGGGEVVAGPLQARDGSARARQQPEGTFVPREERRAAARALRQSAETRLREVLDHRQLAEYEKLSPDLKLLRSDD